eukprot:TRINITY_DN65860_c0_g1_i1.p1 TRINITY_DN65860_c0_g1~~TRINITY_DN65860_c0_g1_i1.p1  ORF type:complete len:281 (-),score=26.32 TRINITY_DN65860_c0_g1_i1:141-908(-)
MEADGKPRRHRALILGWWGSSKRSLYRYEKLHEELGAELVVSVPCSTDAMLGKGADGKQAILKAAEAFDEVVDARVVVHLFSNGGMLLYFRVFKENPHWRGNVAAVIFDSTPGNMSFVTGYRAIMANTPKLRPVSYGVSSVFAFYALRALWKQPGRSLWVVLFLACLSAIASVRSVRKNRVYHNKVIADPMTAPSLYIYSKNDLLVDYRVIERVILGRAQHKPESKCFESSAHVAHCKEHPEEYSAAVQQLLRRV